MMEDFNAAMAGIENGLGQASKKADDASRTAAQTAAAAAPMESLQSGLFRAAYNHYWLLSGQEKLPWQLGVLRQRFGKSAGSGTGLELLEGRARLYSNTAELTLRSLQDTIQASSGYSSTVDLVPITFRAPAAGRLKEVTFYGTLKNSAGDDGNCTVRLYNLTTNNKEAEVRSCFHFYHGTCTDFHHLPLDLPLHVGQRYQLRIHMDSAAADYRIYFRKEDDDCMTFSSESSPSASCAWTIQTGEPSLGGLALVRYRSWGQDGTVRLDWDGSLLEPCAVRTLTDDQGQPLQEAEFRRVTAIPASSSLSLQLACPAGGELEVFEAGAVLI